MAVGSRYTKDNTFFVAVVGLIFLTSGVTTVLSKNCNKNWWYNSCDQRSHQRHARSPATLQLIISSNKMEKLREQLEELYPNFPVADMRNCPKKCFKIRKLRQQINKNSSLVMATSEYYMPLVSIANLLDQISAIPVSHESVSFSEEKRLTYYKNLQYNLKNALCDASQDIKASPIPHALGTKMRQRMCKKKKAKCFRNLTTNFSTIQAIDYCFFNQIQKFFIQAKKKFCKICSKNKTRQKCPRTRDLCRRDHKKIK